MDHPSVTSATTPNSRSICRPFPLPLTGRQWFYLTFLQGVGAGFIDGGANFGIAYASMFIPVLASGECGRGLANVESVPRPECGQDVGV